MHQHIYSYRLKDAYHLKLRSGINAHTKILSNQYVSTNTLHQSSLNAHTEILSDQYACGIRVMGRTWQQKEDVYIVKLASFTYKTTTTANQSIKFVRKDEKA